MSLEARLAEFEILNEDPIAYLSQHYNITCQSTRNEIHTFFSHAHGLTHGSSTQSSAHQEMVAIHVTLFIKDGTVPDYVKQAASGQHLRRMFS